NGIPSLTALVAKSSTPQNTIRIANAPNSSLVAQVFEDGVLKFTGPWSGLSNISVHGFGGSDDVQIDNTVSTVPVFVQSGSSSGTTVVEVSPGQKNLLDIQGPLTLENDFGAARVIFHDENDLPSQETIFTEADYAMGGTAQKSTLQLDVVNPFIGDAL